MTDSTPINSTINTALDSTIDTTPSPDPRLLNALKEGGLLDEPASQDALFLAAAALDYWRIAVPCIGAGSKAAVLTKIADVLQFPDHFGMNLDALYDCITDQLLTNKRKGALLLLTGVKGLPPAALNPIVDTLLDASEFMQTKGQRLVLAIHE